MNGEVYEWLKLNIRSITKKLLGLRDQLIHPKPKVVTTPLLILLYLIHLSQLYQPKLLRWHNMVMWAE